MRRCWDRIDIAYFVQDIALPGAAALLVLAIAAALLRFAFA